MCQKSLLSCGVFVLSGVYTFFVVFAFFFFFQAEDGIRDLVRSRGLGDVYKRQPILLVMSAGMWPRPDKRHVPFEDIEQLR